MIKITANYLTVEECFSIIESLSDIPSGAWAKVSDDASMNDVNAAMKVYSYKRYVGSILNRLSINPTTAVEILKYPTGSYSPIHVDGSGPHFDSSLQSRNITWSRTGIILLNTEFDGGELVFPNLDFSYGKSYKRSLIEFPAGLEGSKYAHGVNPVENGTRYTLVFRD